MMQGLNPLLGVVACIQYHLNDEALLIMILDLQRAAVVEREKRKEGKVGSKRVDSESWPHVT